MEINNKSNKEAFDNSAKNFFSVMWKKNHFLQILIVAIAILVYQLINIEWCIGSFYEAVNDNVFVLIFVSMAMLLPIIVTVTMIYKIGQFWDDLKQDKSR